MKQQQEAALLSAFQVMDDMDRHMLLALAQARAFKSVNKKPCRIVSLAERKKLQLVQSPQCNRLI